MILRTLGLIILVAGLASIIAIALPSITGSPYRSSYYAGANLVLNDNKGIFAIVSYCYNIPYSEAYKTYIELSLERTRYGGWTPPWRIEIANKDRLRLSAYIAPGTCSGLGAPISKVSSFAELDKLIKTMLAARSPSGQVIIYRNLAPHSSIDVTSLGGKQVTVVAVFYIPADSFKLVSQSGTVIPGRQAVQQASSASIIYATPLAQAIKTLEIVSKVKMTPRISSLSYARAASVILAGLLIVAVDAGIHPEYYTGRWRVFLRIAEKLGLRSKGRRH